MHKHNLIANVQMLTTKSFSFREITNWNQHDLATDLYVIGTEC